MRKAQKRSCQTFRLIKTILVRELSHRIAMDLNFMKNLTIHHKSPEVWPEKGFLLKLKVFNKNDVETEKICCSYRTEDGQKRQEKGKVCWQNQSKNYFSIYLLFLGQFRLNGDQRRVGVCRQRRSSLQGDTRQILGKNYRNLSLLVLF